MITNTDWAAFAQIIVRAPNGLEMADDMYKKMVDILDSQVTHQRAVFAEEGTIDLDAIKFVAVADFLQNNIDPGVVAGIAAASIFRLARRK